MAKLRKWCAYKTLERPYTRFSKYRKKAFVKARPGKKVIKHDMGDVKGGYTQFPMTLRLISKEVTSVRTNAIEAARITALKKVEGKLGRFGFYFRIKMHAHHAIRENPLAAGAGADRLSTGMKHSFGKIIGMAARIEAGKTLMEIHIPKEEEAIARLALKSASKKLPIRTSIVTETHKVKELTEEEVKKHHVQEAKAALQDATADLAEADKALLKAEADEDKKKAEADIANAKSKIESSTQLFELKKKELEEFQANN